MTTFTPAIAKIMRGLAEQGDAQAATALALADLAAALREGSEASNRTLAEGLEDVADALRDDGEAPPPRRPVGTSSVSPGERTCDAPTV